MYDNFNRFIVSLNLIVALQPLSDSLPDGGEERAHLLRDLLPRLLAANRSLKDRVAELEDKNSDLARENAELTARLERLTSATAAGGDEGIILGNYNGQVALKAGRPDMLIDALYNPALPGANVYVMAFLSTYRAWTDGKAVMEHVMRSFQSVVSADPAADNGEYFFVVSSL